MNTQSAQRTVILSALVTGGLGFFSAASAGKLPGARFIIGGSVTFLTLSVMADFIPEVAGPLALAIVTTAFFTEGAGILTYVNSPAVKASTKKSATPATTTTPAHVPVAPKP